MSVKNYVNLDKPGLVFSLIALRWVKEMVNIKNPGEILYKLKSRGFLASSFSTYDFSTL